jgi:hypothetical protein
LAALRIICISLAVVFGFLGFVWLGLAVSGLLVGNGLRGWGEAWVLFAPPIFLLVFSAAAFVLRYTVLAPRGMRVRAEEVAGVPVAVYTLLGAVVGTGISGALVLRWDVADWVGLPVTLVCLILGCAVGMARVKPPRKLEGCCPECGYDLRGSPGPRCPECGTPFDLDSGGNADEHADAANDA